MKESQKSKKSDATDNNDAYGNFINEKFNKVEVQKPTVTVLAQPVI